MEDILLCDKLIDEETSWSLVFDEENDLAVKFEHTFITDEQNSFLNDELSNSSNPDQFCGFNSPQDLKRNFLLNLMKDIEFEIENSQVAEKDVVDGIEFLSFASEQELMEYARLQQENRVAASQSDDGLEILDDGSFSDISSNHAIIPTKTKDITRIKGWRNKHFAGIHLCDDSGSSMRNEDDGFGDDFEIKSVRDESSEEVESVGYVPSTASKCGSDAESFNVEGSSDIFLHSTFGKDTFDIDSSDVEDNNAVDNAEESGFNFRKSNEDESAHSFNNFMVQKSFKNKFIKAKPSDLSFDNKLDAFNGVFVQDKHLSSSSLTDQLCPKRCTDSFLLPMAVSKSPQDKKCRSLLDTRMVYKPRVKLSFIESISQKINAASETSPIEENSPTPTVENRSPEKAIRWRVPNEKLLSGNIYDVEVSLEGSDSKQSTSEKSKVLEIPQCPSAQSFEKFSVGAEVKDLSPEITIKQEEIIIEEDATISAFQSSTLDQFTTNLGDLLIDFTIPKLEAAENVTHEEVHLPKEEHVIITPPRAKTKSVDSIKAKTVAEKRRIIAEMNERVKRKQKISFKLRTNALNDSDNKLKRFQECIEKNKHSKLKPSKGKTKVSQKKIDTLKKWFDNRGVLTCGREKPLTQILTKNITSHKPKFTVLQSNHEEKPTNICMVINIGIGRPLFKEAAENLNSLTNDSDVIHENFAKFAASAVQNLSGPLTVTRLLVPVAHEKLKNFMTNFRPEKTRNQGRSKAHNGKQERHLLDPEISNFSQDSSERTSDQIKEFSEYAIVESPVYSVVNEIISYVERKECFDKMEITYDPDVPVSIEKESNTVFNSTRGSESDKKKKKTRLQRQIEALGGTFIAVQGEEGNEESNAKLPETENCMNEFCKMGCVCFKKTTREDHCGKDFCMISCQCPSTPKKGGCEIKSKVWLLPEVLRVQSKSQSKLAPVEREYHQTVIMSKDKKTITIETKNKKRERKAPSKFRDEILLDYRKESCNFIDENVEVVDYSSVINGRTSKQPSRQELAITSVGTSEINSKKRQRSPTITSLDSFLKRFKRNPELKEKGLCYVSVERDSNIEKMATESFRVNNCKASKTKSRVSKSRNVAVKKTGGSDDYLLHSFNIRNHCTRTSGISADYVMRNLACKLRTKDMMLYAAAFHEDSTNNDFHFSHTEEQTLIFKDDLAPEAVTGDESQMDYELECTEKMPNEESSDFAIDFICSLPQELFEKQDSAESKESTIELVPSESDVVSVSNIESIEEVPEKSVSPKARNERIVYASLPTIQSECKWWVIEMDADKFTNLVHISDKRCLSFQDMLRAIFKAEFGLKTVRIPIYNPSSSFGDKFGAYAVPGHKHLIFFGPYSLTESHGIIAIKLNNSSTKILKYNQVPFTTKFPESEGFKSLGIDFSHNGESLLKSTHHSVKAVWWYSTKKKNLMKTITEKTEVEMKSNNVQSLYIGPSGTGNKYDCPTENKLSQSHGMEVVSVENWGSNGNEAGQSKKGDLHGTIITLDEDEKDEKEITIIGPSDNENEKRCSQVLLEETTTKSVDLPFEVSNSIEGSELIESSNNISEAENLDSVPQITPQSLINSTGRPQRTKKNWNGVKFTAPLMKNNSNANKSSNVNKTDGNRKGRNRTKEEIQYNLNIVRLKKKIADLTDVISSVKPVALRKNQKDSLRDPTTDSEDDSSDSSEDDLNVATDKNIICTPELNECLKRVVHNTSKTTKSTWSKPAEKTPLPAHPGGLPSHLIQKVPQKGPIPERALLCLTPNVGYIPVIEFDHTRLTIAEPGNPDYIHQFPGLSYASNWLDNYFKERLTFRKKFTMEWILMKGSIIRKLQPLNKEIFRFRPQDLMISPAGLESPVSLRNDLRNQLERQRRLRIADLSSKMARLVLPVKKERPSNQLIISSAIHMVQVQAKIHSNLVKTIARLSQKRTNLEYKVKTLFFDLYGYEGRKKFFAYSNFIRIKPAITKEQEDENIELMKGREVRLVQRMRDEKRFVRPISLAPRDDLIRSPTQRPESSNSCEDSCKSPPQPQSDIDCSSKVKGQPTEGMLVRRKKLSRPTPHSLGPKLDNCDVIDLVDSDEEKEKEKEEEKEEGKTEENVKVIEIHSEDEDVFCLSDESTSLVIDEDLEIVGLNFPIKKPNVKFPRPKKRLPPTQKTTFVDVETTANNDLGKHATSNQRVSDPISTKEWQSPMELDNCPDAMDSSPANRSQKVSPVAPFVLQGRHSDKDTQIINSKSRSTETEFVAVEGEAYEPLKKKTGAGSSDNSSELVLLATNSEPGDKFLPINASTRVNIVKTTAFSFKEALKVTPELLRPLGSNCMPLQRRTAGLTTLKLKNFTPIGRINPNNKLCRMEGKPILLYKSDIGKMAQFASAPVQQIRQPCPLSLTPVTITQGAPRQATPDRANTVTLYHPSEEISETRTVQFASMSNVRVEPPPNPVPLGPLSVSCAPVLSGPKIRRPNDMKKLRVLLPKRN